MFMRFLPALLLLAGCSLLACGPSPADDKPEPPAAPPADRISEPEVETYPGFPAEVEGCSCELRRADMAGDEYIAVFGYEGPAVIQLSGQQLVLPLQQQSDNSGDNQKVYEFARGARQLRVELETLEKTGDEVWRSAGTLTFSDTQSGYREIFQVDGECGC